MNFELAKISTRNFTKVCHTYCCIDLTRLDEEGRNRRLYEDFREIFAQSGIQKSREKIAFEPHPGNLDSMEVHYNKEELNPIYPNTLII